MSHTVSALATFECIPREGVDCFTAPARSTLRNEIRVFDSGFDEGRTIYQGPPSEANEAAWDDLYNSKCAFSKLDVV